MGRALASRREGAVRHGFVHDLTEIPCTTGVYVFIDPKNTVQYVGKAGGERLRVEAARSLRQRLKGRPGDIIWWAETATNEDALLLERMLIDRYDPPRNGVELVQRRNRFVDNAEFIAILLLVFLFVRLAAHLVPELLAALRARL